MINLAKHTVVLFLLFCLNPYSAQVTLTYTFTGSSQSFTVPSCVSTLSLTARGARGGSNAQGVLGGLGGTAFGVLSVTPGDVLNLYVGGSNGYNGGGLAGVSPCTAAIGGAGGGGSDVRLNGNSLANRVIVGGGGGGAGGNRIMSCGRGTGGGGGSGYYGGGGGSGFPGGGGYTLPTGGSQIAGGIGGISAYTSNNNGLPGSLWTGGAGGTEVSDNQGGNVSAFTGGAGGGLIGSSGQYNWIGGGGQELGSNFCGASGGGGSSYIAGLSNAYTLPGNNSGNGEVLISYTTSIGAMPLNLMQTHICTGSSATLNAASQVSYTWSTGSNLSGIVVSPTVTTTYSVSGTNSLGCVSAGVVTVMVDGNPPNVSIFASSNSVCQGNPVTLNGNGANSYTWSGGVNNGSPFVPASTASYTLSGSNSCGSGTALLTVTVNPNPTLSVSPASVTLCPGNSTTLTALGANSYTWTGGIINGTAFVPPFSNLYSVTGTNSLGCTGTSSAAVTVLPGPSLSPVASPPLICIGATSTISATGANNYTWMPGGSNASSISVSPSITTVYSLTQSIGNCVDIKTVTVNVNSLPSVTASASPSMICTLGSSTLSAPGALSYTWQPNGAVGTSVVVSPTVSTIFTLSASDGTCANSTTLSLIVQPDPILTIALSPNAICAGESATLIVIGASTYIWMPSASTSPSLVVNPLHSSSYTVVGTSSLGCTSAVSQSIVVNPAPLINISATNPLICKGGNSTLSAQGAHSYSWTGGPANQTTVVNPTSTTIFSVMGTYTNTGCTSTQTIAVTVFEPQFTITGIAAVCAGSSTSLTAIGANTYTWNNNHTSPGILVSPTVYTVYQVSATSSSNNVTCSSSQSIGVSVNPNPTVSATASRTFICNGESVVLSASGALTYTWTTFPPGASVTVIPTNQQNYTVTGTDTNGCRNTAYISIKVSACLGVKERVSSEDELFIYPNPNSGEFEIRYSSDINLSLVNALGQSIRVIQLNDQNNHKASVSNVEPGVYFIVGNLKNKLITQKVIVGN